MARYIDIDKMKRWTEVDQKSCSSENCAGIDYDCNECYYNNGGGEDVAPVVHAEWEHKDGIYGVAFCSNCGFELKYNNTNFCSNCGAKMDKE